MTGTFHPTEVEEYFRKEKEAVEHVKYEYIASRWALKEALVKASGRTDLDYTGIYLKKIMPPPKSTDDESIGSRRQLKPVLTVDGDKNKAIFFDELKISTIHSSISHEEDYAVAFVTLEQLVDAD